MPAQKRLLVLLCLLPFSPALAGEKSASGMITGTLGLNTVPNARMDETGTVRFGVSALDPYAHAYLGFQLAEPLYVQLRQSAETSDLQEADKLIPGVDIKLRLMEEARFRPELSLGLQSAIGHKRMAGEYLAASKRYKDFDFTAGIGWGRFAGRGNLPNPLQSLSSHFGGDRNIDGDMATQPNDWFTGDDVGLFAGVEYFIPYVNGLSAKFDWGQDSYAAEHAAFNFEEPPAWSAGLSYKPTSWLEMGVAALGTDKIMARFALTPNIKNWRSQEKVTSTATLQPRRAASTQPDSMISDAANDDLYLYGSTSKNTDTQAKLILTPFQSTPGQIGAAALHMANNSGKEVEEIVVVPTLLGLRGPAVKLMRKDFEQALLKHQGSAEEIWHHASFDPNDEMPMEKISRPKNIRFSLKDIRVVLDQQLSLSEEDSGVLTRTSLLAGWRHLSLFGLLDTGASLRLNLHNNLDQLNASRPFALLPVRSDVDEFAENRIAFDDFYASYTHSFSPATHLAVTGGFLEEMYGGLGSEILYRPFGKRYAFGAELWSAWKRSPHSTMNVGLNGDRVLSGHLNAWYDIPKADLTLQARLGRYLDEDAGGTLALKKRFENGAALEGYATVTNNADVDAFGGETHAMNGIRLTMPLGGFKHMPQGAQIRLKAEPFGRNIGQAIENPVPLYELTEPFSYSHMERHWGDILPKPITNDQKETAF